ncbi:hypothetical protein ACJ72_07371 [Emergomyces africanus]|uniref:Uncharacterized protein n=1 Tax=Emergomyces africanus TaxID=1955775 RepID=A0A1B7NND1_9EURO|nr:hypothetical protein ACJ72_07371 [Emergomyces africanus]
MSTMEEDEDVVMSDMAPPTVIPIGPGRPLGGSPEKPPSPLELNGTPAPAQASSAHATVPSPAPPLTRAPSLMNAFREKFASTGNVVKSVISPKDHATADTPESKKSPEDIKYDSDEDSLVEEDSDWPNDSAEDTRGLPLASLATGLCYDIRMRYHCEVKPTLDVHPEDPRRIYYIYKELCKAGLVDDPDSSRPLVPQPLQRIGAREATEEEISLVHDSEHYAS